MTSQQQKTFIEDFMSQAEVSIPSNVAKILKELESLGFEFKAIAPNGSYFEVINRKEWRGEMWVRQSKAEK